MTGWSDPGPSLVADTVYAALEEARSARASVGRRFLVGITGSVAVGKSHLAAEVADFLRELGVAVEVVSTDGFLLPNAELDRRGLTLRKGFPESFDRAALAEFLALAAGGVVPIRVPEYDHFRYDVVPDGVRSIGEAEVVVVEGLCLLGPGAVFNHIRIADLLSFRIAVTADLADIRSWYRERFLSQAERALDEPGGFWDLFAGLSRDELLAAADLTWDAINEPNLREHIDPGLAEADLLVRKRADHRVVRVRDLNDPWDVD